MESIKAKLLANSWTIVKKIKYNDLIFHKTGDELRIQIETYSPEKWLARIEGIVGSEKKYLCIFGYSDPYTGLNALVQLERQGII